MGATCPAPEILDSFQAREPAFVVETALATIWKVRSPRGEAALKVYHGEDMKNEAAGFDLLAAWDGHGAAKLYGRTARAALLEWLPGPSLGDLTRTGRDDDAAAHLGEAARTLHARSMPAAMKLPDLTDWLADLFAVTFAPSCPPDTRRNMGRCQALARRLLSSPTETAALHGDLHHDNIRWSERGYCAFDAKGVRGDRAFELANAFRNPIGAEDRQRDPARVRHLADCWSESFAVDRSRLLAWAAVKCALSIAWRAGGPLERDPEFDLLALLTSIAPEGH